MGPNQPARSGNSTNEKGPEGLVPHSRDPAATNRQGLPHPAGAGWLRTHLRLRRTGRHAVRGSLVHQPPGLAVRTGGAADGPRGVRAQDVPESACAPSLIHQLKRAPKGPFQLVEVAGVEPASKTRRVAVHPQACSALETPRRGTDEPLGACAFQSRCRLEGEGGTHPVPPFGRPKPPVGKFNESATRRSRFLARRLSCLKRQEPIRSCRWQFVLGGLMRGPAVQPPPAPCTWIMTCRNRSPPCVLWCLDCALLRCQ